MEVNILNLQELFNGVGRYEIPPFQRAYVWDQENQWESLWEDVQSKAEQWLEPDPGQPTPHFLGAVVLQQKTVRTPRLQTREVVDGQQRLTTLQLLLDAVQEVFEEREYADAAKRLDRLVLNPEEYRRGDPDNAFKVWPTMDDREAFRYAMRNELASEEHEESLIVQAHEFFKLQTRQWLDAHLQDDRRRADALEEAVTDLLHVVVIDLGATDDPLVIFETLNARGTPLLHSDLIKNMILIEARKGGTLVDSDGAVRLWRFPNDWWRQEIPQGPLYRPRIDVFLNYWLVMRKREEVNANDVFNVFRSYYKSGNSPIEDVAVDIGCVGKYYRSLEESTIPDMDTFLYRWGVMKAGVLTPVLLWLLSSEVSKQQMQKGLCALESYLVRRMVCGITTRGYNRLFVDLLNDMDKSGPECAGDAIVEFFGRQEAYGRLWPSDRWLEDALTERPLYRLLTRGRLRIVLEGIEAELRTGMAESGSVHRNLTIEHIMPQQWRENWGLQQVPSSLEVESELEATERRNSLIHSIGNLTLVNKKLNPALSNAPWEEKRAGLSEHSTLFLNKDLLANAPDVWDEDAIKARARRLFQAAARVWPHADKI